MKKYKIALVLVAALIGSVQSYGQWVEMDDVVDSYDDVVIDEKLLQHNEKIERLMQVLGCDYTDFFSPLSCLMSVISKDDKKAEELLEYYLVRDIVFLGLDINFYKEKKGESPLIIAAANGNNEVVKQLVKASWRIDNNEIFQAFFGALVSRKNDWLDCILTLSEIETLSKSEGLLETAQTVKKVMITSVILVSILYLIDHDGFVFNK